MDRKHPIGLLRGLVKTIAAAGVTTNQAFGNWVREPGNDDIFAKGLAYTNQAGRPNARSLIQSNFHPTLPLVGLNYTKTAHVTLHTFHDGWTDPMRLCRGIVFDYKTGRLVGLPYPKFFNDGEHDETRNLPNGKFVATVKEDGHLGIIFEYEDDLLLTTRGYFTSPSSQLGNEMLASRKKHWLKVMPKSLTVLVEMIHPRTRVHTDYFGREEFVLIGAYNRRTYKYVQYDELTELGQRLGIRVTERWQGNSLSELQALMADLSVTNQEGLVAYFPDSDLHVKFKFKDYVSRMIEKNLDLKYAMRRIMEGSADSRFADLAPRVRDRFAGFRDQVMAAGRVAGGKKAQWAYLYGLQTGEACNDTYKQVCRQFVRWLEDQGEAA